MGRVASLWRYPIKAIGREERDVADFVAGQTMPGDRIWAVAHQKGQAADNTWASCGNFLRACNVPALHAVALSTDQSGSVTLTHPDQPDLHVNLHEKPQALLDWLAPLVAGTPYTPDALISTPARGMTDAPFPSVTLCNLSSHKALEQRAGMDLSIHRWRGNIWLDGLAPWAEFDWEGRTLKLGGAEFRIIERTGRCKATHANPETGLRDLDMLGLLGQDGHTDFSMQAEVIKSGPVARGDTLDIL